MWKCFLLLKNRSATLIILSLGNFDLLGVCFSCRGLQQAPVLQGGPHSREVLGLLLFCFAFPSLDQMLTSGCFRLNLSNCPLACIGDGAMVTFGRVWGLKSNVTSSILVTPGL